MYAENHCIPAVTNAVLKSFPVKLTSTNFFQLIHAVNSCNVCAGNYDEQFIRLARYKKGYFYAINKELVAVLEESFCFTVEGVERCCTIRHVKCEILLVKNKITCVVCISYRSTLRALVSKTPRSPTSRICPYTNKRFLRTPRAFNISLESYQKQEQAAETS